MATRRLLKKFGIGASCGAAGYVLWCGLDRWIFNGIPPMVSATDIKETREVFRQKCQNILGYDVVVHHYWTNENYLDPYITPEVPLKDLPAQEPTPYEKVKKKVTNGIRFMMSWEDDSGREERSRAIAAATAGLDSNGQLIVENRTPIADPDAHRGTKFASMSIVPSVETRQSASFRGLLDNLTHQSFHRCSKEVVVGVTGDPTNCVPDDAYLAAPYLRMMVSAFSLGNLPLPHSMKVACIGVAGGTLPMFLQRYFGSNIAQMDLVDVEPVVFDVATKKLALRQLSDSNNLKYHTKDGLVFLHEIAMATQPASVGVATNKTNQSKYDAIFVDAFIGSRTPAHLEQADFILSLRMSLKSTGICAMNVSGDNARLFTEFQNCFGKKNVFIVKAPGTPNYVILACKNAPMHGISKRHVVKRARQLSRDYRLPFELGNHFPLSWSVW